MVHLRLIAPAGVAERVLDLLSGFASVFNIVHLPGASRKPAGDLFLCDVAREDASILVAELRGLGLEREGTIVVETADTAISEAARRAVELAVGSPADAVVWEEVEARTSESAELSYTFVALMVVATLIAAAGILNDSLILIIGAMVVGPEFGPLAGFCIAAVQRRGDLARRSLLALLVGFPAGIVASLLGTLVARAADRAPDALTATTHPATLFISNPNVWSIVVAVLAGVAGVLSLTTAKSSALIGVLISVTTIPAAANVGAALAYADWNEASGALSQLALNLVAIMAAGAGTLSLQRAVYARRLARHRAA